MTSESSWNHGLRWKSLARQDAVQPTVTKAPKGVGSALGCHVMSLLVISHLHLLSAHIMFISCYPNLLELDPFFAVFCTIFSNFCAWGFEAHSEGDASAAWTHWRTSAGSRGAESDCPGMVPMVKGDDFLCCTVPLLWSRRFWARDFFKYQIHSNTVYSCDSTLKTLDLTNSFEDLEGGCRSVLVLHKPWH